MVPAPVVSDPAALPDLAARHQDAFEVMAYLLERDEIGDDDLDALVDLVAAPVVAAIDCTQCANCCRSLHVYLTPQDAQRIAAGIDVPLADVETRYIDRAGAQPFGEWGRLRAQPCPFLDGRLCSIYPQRPETCRTYPAFTPDFRWVLADLIEGATLCPIIFNVLLRMVSVAEALSRTSDFARPGKTEHGNGV